MVHFRDWYKARCKVVLEDVNFFTKNGAIFGAFPAQESANVCPKQHIGALWQDN